MTRVHLQLAVSGKITPDVSRSAESYKPLLLLRPSFYFSPQSFIPVLG